jgi:diketogulonate reductase-like aldo/keto reductase
MEDIPRIGLGTAEATDPTSLIAAIVHAVEECGYRYIDTALVYGNESIVGEALQLIFSKGTIKRSDVWVTTKLWVVDRRPDRVEPAIQRSLANLKLDCVNLYLVHCRTTPESRESLIVDHRIITIAPISRWMTFASLSEPRALPRNDIYSHMFELGECRFFIFCSKYFVGLKMS